MRAEADRLLPLSRAFSAGIESGCWKVLSHRPGRRLVLANGETVLKGYRRGRSEMAASRHRLAVETTGQAGDFRVPRLTAHDPTTSSLRMERILGSRPRISERRAEGFFAVGWAIRRFQRGGGEEWLPTFGVRDELAVVDRWAGRTVELEGRLPEAWRAVRARLDGVREELPAPRLGLTHRDLHDGQLLESRPGPALLDFDLLCRADVALDPANLLAHLTLRALQRQRGADEQGAHACGQALLEGLDRSGERGFWRRLRFYQATTFLRLTLVYGLRPRWSSLCESLSELAGRCLDELRDRL